MNEITGMFPLPFPNAALEANTDRDSIWPRAVGIRCVASNRVRLCEARSRGSILEVLDLCNTVSSSPRRQVTTIAPQALTLFNGEFIQQQSRRFAERLRLEAGPDPARQMELAYRLALCRPPTASERDAVLGYLREGSLSEVCRVIFNLNEFAYPE
jgi:hypothetical protein